MYTVWVSLSDGPVSRSIGFIFRYFLHSPAAPAKWSVVSQGPRDQSNASDTHATSRSYNIYLLGCNVAFSVSIPLLIWHCGDAIRSRPTLVSNPMCHLHDAQGWRHRIVTEVTLKAKIQKTRHIDQYTYCISWLTSFLAKHPVFVCVCISSLYSNM